MMKGLSVDGMNREIGKNFNFRHSGDTAQKTGYAEICVTRYKIMEPSSRFELPTA